MGMVTDGDVLSCGEDTLDMEGDIKEWLRGGG